MRAFISYSHLDAAALERLHTHLAVLRREGRIDAWFDRNILAGGELDPEIEEQLESCELFLLLVSPDFLASDYCVEREMDRALERHYASEARVIPIIVEPCDWQSTSLGRLKALPHDGKPIVEWRNQNSAYLEIVTELRRISETEGPGHVTEHGSPVFQPESVSATGRPYRVKRDFDEIDRSDFREAAFSVIRIHFERSIGAINAIEDVRGRFESLSATSFTCTIVNSARRYGTAHITVHGRTNQMALGDISYSFVERGGPGTANGVLTIQADEYELFLSSMMMNFGRDSERLTPEEAADQIWQEFAQHAGITYE